MHTVVGSIEIYLKYICNELDWKFHKVPVQSYFVAHFPFILAWHKIHNLIERMDHTKVPILKECHFGKMKLWRVEHFWTYLSSHLGVIAIVFSNHTQKWRQKCPKVFNPSEFHFSEVTFFQNWYRSTLVERNWWITFWKKCNSFYRAVWILALMVFISISISVQPTNHNSPW